MREISSPLDGFLSPLGRLRSSAAPSFDPASLFSSGEEGAWYEPSTATTFTDLEGFTFATYGQPVAHLIDKSQGATIEARRNLLKYTEDFSSGDWLLFGGASKTGTNVAEAPDSTISADSIRLTSADTNSNVYQLFSTGLPVSTELTFSVWVKRNAATDQTFQLFQNVRGATPFGKSGDLVATDTWQRFTFSHSEAGGTVGSVFGIIGNVAGTQADLLVWGAQLEEGSSATAYQKITDGQTVSWLLGNHATQVTAGARPILARVPEGGRRNELSETDTLATQSVTVTAAERTLSFKGTGTVTLSGASTAGPLIGTGADDRVDLTFTPSAGSLTLTVLGTVTDAQLELGSTATNYQSVADLLGYDVTEAGVTSLEYLFDDEADDVLPWTAPTDTDYTVAYVNTSGTASILTAQSLSGATDILLDPALVGYVAVDRALTSQETTDLTAYLEALA